MNSSDNPLIRGTNPFEKRIARAVAQAKPNLRSPGVFGKSLPGGTSLFTARRSSSSRTLTPFSVRSDYSVVPGLVGGKMPTIGGVRLDNTTPPVLSIPGSGVRYLFFKLTFTTTFTNSYLTAFSLSTVEITVESTSSPSDTASVKHLQFQTTTDGVPLSASLYDTSISVALADNGINDTLLFVY